MRGRVRNLYGTSGGRTPSAFWSHGRDLVLVIDVQGGQAGPGPHPGTVGVFRDAVLLSRAVASGGGAAAQDTEAAMQRRLETARAEVAAFAEYEYVIVNDELDACVDRLRAIVLAERTRLRSARTEAERIVSTFR